jgi:uroporphyrinogen decarboxylase
MSNTICEKNMRAANFLKAMRFEYPAWVPCSMYFLPAAWIKHRESLEESVLAHPRVFPGYRQGQVDFDYISGGMPPSFELGRHTDCWGVVWENLQRGCEGIVVEEPLKDWAAFPEWERRLPDPEKDDCFGPRDWEKLRGQLEAARRQGDVAAVGPLMHGCFFMLLYYLRGFENLLVDMVSDEPMLRELSDRVLAYNTAVIRRCLDFAPELMILAEDLGMQTSLPISPDMWRRWVKPGYEAMCRPCRERGIPVYLHSDGQILDIIPDLIEVGVRILNPQFRANGLRGLQEVARGRVCLDQDLDRQLMPFATPSQLEDHVGEIVDGLDRPEGGLMIKVECGPDVPLENVEAVCRGLEKYCRLPEAMHSERSSCR